MYRRQATHVPVVPLSSTTCALTPRAFPARRMASRRWAGAQNRSRRLLRPRRPRPSPTTSRAPTAMESTCAVSVRAMRWCALCSAARARARCRAASARKCARRRAPLLPPALVAAAARLHPSASHHSHSTLPCTPRPRSRAPTRPSRHHSPYVVSGVIRPPSTRTAYDAARISTPKSTPARTSCPGPATPPSTTTGPSPLTRPAAATRGASLDVLALPRSIRRSCE